MISLNKHSLALPCSSSSQEVFSTCSPPPLPPSTLGGQRQCRVSHRCSRTALAFLGNAPQHRPLQPHFTLRIQTPLHAGARTLLDGRDALKGSVAASCPAALDLLPAPPRRSPPTFSPLPGTAQVPLPQPAHTFPPSALSTSSLLFCIKHRSRKSLASLKALQRAWAYRPQACAPGKLRHRSDVANLLSPLPQCRRTPPRDSRHAAGHHPAGQTTATSSQLLKHRSILKQMKSRRRQKYFL